MFEKHVTRKSLNLIEPQGGARDPDRRLDPDPGYAFQGEKISCVPELTLNCAELLFSLTSYSNSILDLLRRIYDGEIESFLVKVRAQLNKQPEIYFSLFKLRVPNRPFF